MGRTALSLIERGRKAPSVINLARIALALGMGLEDFVHGGGTEGDDMRAWTKFLVYMALSVFQWLTFLFSLRIAHGYVTDGCYSGLSLNEMKYALVILLLFSIAAGVLKRDVGEWT